jgi:hypothetical protein
VHPLRAPQVSILGPYHCTGICPLAPLPCHQLSQLQQHLPVCGAVQLCPPCTLPAVQWCHAASRCSLLMLFCAALLGCRVAVVWGWHCSTLLLARITDGQPFTALGWCAPPLIPSSPSCPTQHSSPTFSPEDTKALRSSPWSSTLYVLLILTYRTGRE